MAQLPIVAPNFTETWVSALSRMTMATTVSDDGGRVKSLDEGVLAFRRLAAHHITDNGGQFILAGNGGSLAIAAHIATDFCLCGWPSIALTDAVTLTSHTNDYGAEANFSKQLELSRILVDDILIVMSCSGKSPNILDAVRFAKSEGHKVVTLSGFEHDNPLRSLGDLNFHVPAFRYGWVQLAHESILHAACDIEAGWTP